MTSSSTGNPGHNVKGLAAEALRLRAQNEQLKQAVSSHAVVDQAIGAVTALGQIHPDNGFAVLREVSQRMNVKLPDVAHQLLGFAQGHTPPTPLLEAFRSVLAEHTSAAGRAAGDRTPPPAERPDIRQAPDRGSRSA